jgi:uncharacterized protein YecT (DUF1311 family)
MIWFLLAIAEPTFEAEVAACQSDEHVLTFCLAQRAYDRADARLNAQWKATFRRVRAAKGKSAAMRLLQGQRRWIKVSEARCETIFPKAPPQQQGRNFLECMAEVSDRRTAQLRSMVVKL